MSVLNRSMFQRPMPVVRRMAGTPKTGETIVQEEVIQTAVKNAYFLPHTVVYLITNPILR